LIGKRKITREDGSHINDISEIEDLKDSIVLFQNLSLLDMGRLAPTGTPEFHGRGSLAYFKADVDNLGLIFSEGLLKKDKEGNLINFSVSRYHTLSRMLEGFFKGYLNFLIEESGQKDFLKIYSVYTGGDDLLFIGPVKSMFKFVSRVYSDLRRFVCFNDSITLSAAITVLDPRIPARRAVEIADDHLEKSKKGGKNRVTIFGKTITWNQFFELMKHIQLLEKHLREALEKPHSKGFKLTKNFLQKLLRYKRLADELIINSRFYGLTFEALYRYDMARLVKKPEDVPEELRDFFENKLIGPVVECLKLKENERKGVYRETVLYNLDIIVNYLYEIYK